MIPLTLGSWAHLAYALCIVAAFALAYYDIPGWGWLIFIAVILYATFDKLGP